MERAGERAMKRGEIWLVSLDPTSGHEQRGRRPVLIVSPEPFNRVTKVPVVLPITSGGNFARAAGFAVPLTGAGTKTTGIIRCDQPRALDLAARGGKKLESIPDAIVGEVLARIVPIFE
jgi:mRNA-degrading endonuclease toxin of MazEF toxin-antitoxin module